MDGTADDGRRLKPPPPRFREIFIEEGWRGVELEFGSRTSCNKRWVEECGGIRLKQERLTFLKERSARRIAERQRMLDRQMLDRQRAWRAWG